MKKLFKRGKWILIIVILLFAGVYFYTKTYWNKFTNEIEIMEIVSEIKNAEKLPEKFYELYELENPKSLTYDLNRQMINGFFSSQMVKPPSAQVAVSSLFNRGKINFIGKFKFAETSVAWKLESNTTQRECLNWIAHRCDFLFRIIGIKQASLYYFEKELIELNERELATLVLMMNNPRQYNPKREIKEEIIKLKVDELLEKVK